MDTELMVKTRFAPSPTGLMHYGNLRTALFNYLFAKKNEGTFLLRIEDTDRVRSTNHYLEDLLIDLEWLGINWQEGPMKQSEREPIYEQYYRKLTENNLAYPCFCSEETLAISRKVQMASNKPPRYEGTCRHLSEQQRAEKFATGQKAALRFAIPKGSRIEFTDLVKGLQSFAAEDIGDFIIRRSDGTASFMFCNAIDDALMEVTHALRGDDHLTNTPRQLWILKALNLPAPQYGHFPMIVGPDGTKLSKRNGSRSIQELRLEGFHILAILNYLSGLGHHYTTPKLRNISELAHEFSLDNIASSPARFDAAQLQYWQKEAMHQSSAEEFWNLTAPFVQDRVPSEKKQAWIDCIQANIIMPAETLSWAEIFFTDKLEYSDTAVKILQAATPQFFVTAIEFVQQKDTIYYSALIQYLQSTLNIKGKAIFMPLRIGVTGESAGPEMAKLFELMGKELLIKRLEKAKKHAQHL